jgi:hypothetical protein
MALLKSPGYWTRGRISSRRLLHASEAEILGAQVLDTGWEQTTYCRSKFPSRLSHRATAARISSMYWNLLYRGDAGDGPGDVVQEPLGHVHRDGEGRATNSISENCCPKCCPTA